MHKKSTSNFEYRRKGIQQAVLVKSKHPTPKKTMNFTSNWNKSLTHIDRGQQSGGFSYNDFYDSLRVLNDRSVRYLPLNSYFRTILIQ